MAALTARGSGLDCFQPQPWQLVSTRSSRAPCAFPDLRCCPRCWLFSCLGSCSHLRILPNSTKRSAAAIFGRGAPSFLFHGVLWNILLSAGFPVTIHMIAQEQTFANGPLQKISLADASESNRFYPCFRESRDVVSADIPVC